MTVTFVTGGVGFIGLNLIPNLTIENNEAHSLVRCVSELLCPCKRKLIPMGDLTDTLDMKKIMWDTDPRGCRAFGGNLTRRAHVISISLGQ